MKERSHSTDLIEKSGMSQDYQDFFESNPNAMWVYDFESLAFLAVNEVAIAHYGYSREEFLAMSIRDIRPPEDLPVLEKSLTSAPFGFEGNGTWRHRKKDGGIIDVEITSHTVEFNGRRAKMVLVRDVTEQKEADEALRQNEERYRALLEATETVVWHATPEGNVVFATDKWNQLTGQTDQERAGWGWLEAIHPDDREPAAQNWQHSLETQSILKNEFRVRMRDGTYRWFLVRGVPVLRADGGVREWAGANTDIHERKVAEAALLESEERNRNIVETAEEGIWMIDAEAHTSFVNPKMAQMLGYSVAEMVGRPLVDFMDEEGRAITEANIKRREQGIAEKHDFKFFRKDGSEVWTSLSANSIRDSRGRYAGALAMVMDITQRRRAEAALRESEERLQILIQSAPAGVAMLDRELRYIACSRRWLADYDLEGQDIIGKSHYEVFPDIPERWKEVHRRCLTGISEKCDEDRFERANGTVEYLRWEIQPWKDAFGAIGGLVFFTETITARKLAEAALRESHALLTKVSRQVPGFLYQYQLFPNGRSCFPYASAGIREIYGVSPEEVREDAGAVFAVLHPQDYDAIVASIRESARTLNPWQLEYRVILPGQGVRWRVGDARPERLEDGSTLWHGYISDSTARKEADVALMASEGRLSAIYANVPAGIFYLGIEADGNLRFLSTNQAFFEATGLTENQVIGRLAQDVIPASSLNVVLGKYHEAIRSRKVVRWNEVFINPAGERHGEVSVTPILDTSGACTHLIGIVHDITALKRAEAERLSLERQVQHAQKLESLGVLAGGIAHDFNNLLTAVMGNISLAAMDLPPVTVAREHLREAEKATERAADLARQMLAYSGKGHFTVQLVNLREFIEEMTPILQVSISKKAILRFDCAANVPTIEADITQLRQIILNLVINASDAIGERSGVIAISTSAEEVFPSSPVGPSLPEPLPSGLYACLEVADTGCGIAPEQLGKIFDPFFTTKFTGRGLGLAAVQGIVRSHKGALKVTSEIGKGTKFKVLFPAREEPADLPTKPPGESSDWRGEGCVLLVDDEESIRATGSRKLQNRNRAILVSGRFALKILIS